MAATELKIDDDYVAEVSAYIATELNDLDSAYQNYIGIMTNIREDALFKGLTADALEAFIEYAQTIEGKLSELGVTSQNLCDKFIQDVDLIDQYLF